MTFTTTVAPDQYPTSGICLVDRFARSVVCDGRVAWRARWLLGCFPRLGRLEGGWPCARGVGWQLSERADVLFTVDTQRESKLINCVVYKGKLCVLIRM